MATEFGRGYESSDEEFPQPPQEFPNAGARSIQALSTDETLRAATKAFVKTLQQGGNWYERYNSALWMNRLDEFRKVNLKENVKTCPDSESVERFLVAFVLKRSTPAKPLAYDTIEHAKLYIHKALTFRHAEYQRTDHHISRLAGVSSKFLSMGLLTKRLNRSKEPAGAIVARRLITSWFHDAVTEGSSDWSTTLNDIASLFFIACFQCRPKDIIGDSKDPRSDLPGLRYSDIDMVVGKGGGLNDIEMRIEMRNWKAQGGDHKKYFYLSRGALRKDADNLMCPVKWILILAMRSGNAKARTVLDVLEIAKERRDRRIMWRYPNRPVLCGSGAGDGIDWERLMPKTRATYTLTKALRIMGTDAHVMPCSFRYGAADDLLIAKAEGKGLTLDQLGEALNHSRNSRASDTTLAYAQTYSNADYWKARMEITPEELPFSKFIHATDEKELEKSRKPGHESRKRRRKEDVDLDCERQGLDPSLSTNRYYRSQKNTPVSEGQKSPFLEASQIVQETEGDDASNALDMDLDDLGKEGGELEGEALGQLLDDVQEKITATENVSKVADEGQALIRLLSGDGTSYVDRYASINIVRVFSKKRSKRYESAQRTGADAESAIEAASLFTFTCPKGCGFSSATSIEQLDSHVLRCEYEEGNRQKAAKTKSFICPQEECGKGYMRKGELTAHLTQVHERTKCYVKGCPDETEYVGTKELFQNHISSAHPAKGRPHPTMCDHTNARFSCPMTKCQETFLFYVSRSFYNVGFNKHLQNKHGIISQETRRDLTPSFPGNPCFYPGCQSRVTYPLDEHGYENYARHLVEDHQVIDEEEQFEYGWKRVRGQAMPMRSD